MTLATLAICTYNRADCLADAVRSVVVQEAPFPFEVMVIDNNSTDGTRDLVMLLQRESADLRYVFESKQGLSRARNRALEESEAEIVAYIDDDAVAHEGWLTALVAGFSDPTIAVVGGRIEVSYPVDRPAWVTDKMEVLLGRFGPADMVSDVSEVFGGNFAVRRRVALEIGGFSEILGYQGDRLLPGEETGYCLRARKAGYRVVYIPDAQVTHSVHPSRLSKQWFLRRAKGTGEALATMRYGMAMSSEIAEELVWLWINRSGQVVRGNSDQSFYCSMRMVQQTAMLSGMLPGPLGALRRAVLMLRCIPKACLWLASTARNLLLGRELPRA